MRVRLAAFFWGFFAWVLLLAPVAAQTAATDGAALCDVYSQQSAAVKTGLTNWCPGSAPYNPCSTTPGTWWGVTCATVGGASRVVSLSVSSKGLGGTLPTTIGNLGALTWMNLYSNSLSSSIPSELGLLTNLQGLYLNDNMFTSAVPSSFCNFNTGINLYINSNPGLTCLPSCLSNPPYTYLTKDATLTAVCTSSSSAKRANLGAGAVVGIVIGIAVLWPLISALAALYIISAQERRDGKGTLNLSQVELPSRRVDGGAAYTVGQIDEDDPIPQPTRATVAALTEVHPGLTENVAELSETPTQLLQRRGLLGPTETVLATFDVKFAGPDAQPMWKVFALCIFTLGLYLFVIFFRVLAKMCHKWRCCTPELVEIRYGKMAVTSNGRLVCWSERVRQKKLETSSWAGTPCLLYLDWVVVRAVCFIPSLCCGLDKLMCACIWCPFKCLANLCCRELCAAPVQYKTTNVCRVYRSGDIRQISQFFSSEAMCIFCCLNYHCGIEVSFNQYDHGSNHLDVASWKSWFSKDHFGANGQAAANSFSRGSYWDWARKVYGVVSDAAEAVEDKFGGTSNLTKLVVLSSHSFCDCVDGNEDEVHSGNADEVLRNLTLLHKKLLACLPTLQDAIVPVDIDANGIRLTQGSGFNVGSTSIGKVEFTNWFKLVQVVKNDGTCQLPADWVPLLPDERIVAVNGQVPIMGFIEWFWSIYSLGFWYVVEYRHRKYTRSALVLTNKRLVTMDLYERSGSIPASLSNFSVQVRCYILDKVSSGYIRSPDRNNLEAGIETPAGAINIHFRGTGRKAMAFAQAMQMSTERRRRKVNLNHVKKPIASDKSAAFKLLPLLGKEETLVDWIRSEKAWEPFCPTSANGIFNKSRQCCTLLGGCGACCECMPVRNACSRESLDENSFCGYYPCLPYCLYPTIPYILSLALRPFQTRDDVVVTNMTILRFSRSENFGLCGCLRFCGLLSTGYCVSNDRFTMSWEPIEAFSGFSVAIDSEGDETVLSRMWRGSWLGSRCCPIGSAQVKLHVDFRGKYSFEVTRGGDEGEENKVWIKDEELAQNTLLLSEVQRALDGAQGGSALSPLHAGITRQPQQHQAQTQPQLPEERDRRFAQSLQLQEERDFQLAQARDKGVGRASHANVALLPKPRPIHAVSQNPGLPIQTSPPGQQQASLSVQADQASSLGSPLPIYREARLEEMSDDESEAGNLAQGLQALGFETPSSSSEDEEDDRKGRVRDGRGKNQMLVPGLESTPASAELPEDAATPSFELELTGIYESTEITAGDMTTALTPASGPAPAPAAAASSLALVRLQGKAERLASGQQSPNSAFSSAAGLSALKRKKPSQQRR